MEKKIARLKDHYIVCGYGRIGKVICQILHENRRPFVVIENNPVEVANLTGEGFFVVVGNSSDEETLLKASVDKAKALIAVVSSDADNVYIILSAKELNPGLFVLARSSGEKNAETKMLRAGADKVISPYYIGACRMAQLVVRPTVIDFIDLTVHSGELGLRLEELSVSSQASFVGKTLGESGIRKEFDLIVVAIKRHEDEMQFNPNLNTRILDGDILIVLGEHNNIKAFEATL
jgi:voltage-gated potassium channel